MSPPVTYPIDIPDQTGYPAWLAADTGPHAHGRGVGSYPRRATLQAFAADLNQLYAFPCHLVWHPQSAHRHRLYYWAVPNGWQCEVGTEEDLAHRLHSLGMALRAAQRQLAAVRLSESVS